MNADSTASNLKNEFFKSFPKKKLITAFLFRHRSSDNENFRQILSPEFYVEETKTEKVSEIPQKTVFFKTD